MVPRYIEFKEELPKNANDFIQKFILRKEWESGRSQKNAYDAKINEKKKISKIQSFTLLFF